MDFQGVSTAIVIMGTAQVIALLGVGYLLWRIRETLEEVRQANTKDKE